MNVELKFSEHTALHGLLETVSDDVVLRINHAGFIEDASPNLEQLGFDLSQLLLAPHFADLVQPEYRGAVDRYAQRVFARDTVHGHSEGWVEFPLVTAASAPPDDPAQTTDWFALKLRTLPKREGMPRGAIGLLRSVARLRMLEGEVYRRTLVDPLTGLANRHALSASIGHHLAQRGEAQIALFAVDHMRAIVLQYGQRTADEILWGFAKFLENMVYDTWCDGGQDTGQVAQFDADRFCVILPNCSENRARAWVKDMLETFGALALSDRARTPKLSASAGVAAVQSSVDWTLRQAELALVMARAQGGTRVVQWDEAAPPPAV